MRQSTSQMISINIHTTELNAKLKAQRQLDILLDDIYDSNCASSGRYRIIDNINNTWIIPVVFWFLIGGTSTLTFKIISPNKVNRRTSHSTRKQKLYYRHDAHIELVMSHGSLADKEELRSGTYYYKIFFSIFGTFLSQDTTRVNDIF